MSFAAYECLKTQLSMFRHGVYLQANENSGTGGKRSAVRKRKALIELLDQVHAALLTVATQPRCCLAALPMTTSACP